MDAYEFSTEVTKTGYVAIPTEYIDHIPQGTAVRVLILVDETKAIKKKVKTDCITRSNH